MTAMGRRNSSAADAWEECDILECLPCAESVTGSGTDNTDNMGVLLGVLFGGSCGGLLFVLSIVAVRRVRRGAHALRCRGPRKVLS